MDSRSMTPELTPKSPGQAAFEAYINDDAPWYWEEISAPQRAAWDAAAEAARSWVQVATLDDLDAS